MSEAARVQLTKGTSAPFDDATLAMYRGALLAFVKRRVPDHAEADDLVQEALARLVVSSRGHDVREPQAYLFRIAANLVADFHRRQQRRGGATIALEEHHAPGIAAEQENRRHSEDLQRLFEAALDELGPRCREVFILHRFDELPTWSIAVRLKITPRMVQKHIAAATAHLYARLAHFMESHP